MQRIFIWLIIFIPISTLSSQDRISPFVPLSKNITINRYGSNSQVSNQIQELNVNGNNTRDIIGSTVVVANVVDKYDGTVDIILDINIQSSDTSYVDAVSYSFPDNIVINNGSDINEAMPDSTSSALCSIVFGVETNSITFGDASFLQDAAAGSGWGCINTGYHQHVINVNMFTDDFEIDYYLADDCYSTCNDIIGQLTVEGIEIPIISTINELSLTSGQEQLTLSWSPPLTSFDNQDIQYNNNDPSSVINMSTGEAVVGTFFKMPDGSGASSVGSIDVFGYEGYSGETMLYGYNFVDGLPSDSATYSMPVSTISNEWVNLELGWSFEGDFLIGVKITTSIGIGVDESTAPSNHSWINIGGWVTWRNLANNYNLPDGEWGIRAKNVTADGLAIDYLFNVYKSENDNSLNLISEGQASSYFIDDNVEVESNYCYSVTAVNNYESDFSPLVCYNTENGFETVSATLTFSADLSQLEGFDPLYHSIEVRGSWDQWGSGNYMQNAGGSYYSSIDVSGSPGQIMEWNFKAGPDDVWLNNGWESDEARTFVFTGQDIQFSNPTLPDIISWQLSLIPEFDISDSWALPGDTVAVEFSFSSGNESFSMSSFESSFDNFESEFIEFIGIDTSNSLIGQTNWIISTNFDSGNILVAAAGSQPISESGMLFKLKFAIDSEMVAMENQLNQLSLQNFMANEFNIPNLQGEVFGDIFVANCASNYVTIFCDNGAYQEEVSWVLFNSNDDSVASGGAPFYLDTCLPDDGYTLQMFDSYGDGWSGVTWGVYDIVSDSTLIYASLEDGESETFEFYIGDFDQLSGCMDQNSLNFDPSAIYDDGSCLFEGDMCSSSFEAVEGETGNSADGGDEWFHYTLG